MDFRFRPVGETDFDDSLNRQNHLKILIVVVVGAAILAIMNVAMPNLFQSLINKISGELVKVTVLP